jgi:hypothetical protein
MVHTSFFPFIANISPLVFAELPHMIPMSLSGFVHLQVISYYILSPISYAFIHPTPDPFDDILHLLESIDPENKIQSLLLTIVYPNYSVDPGALWMYDSWVRLDALLSQPKFYLAELRLHVLVNMVDEEELDNEGLFRIRKEDLELQLRERLMRFDEDGILFVQIDMDVEM